jgi:DNA-binding HxlR family transcriptional regulator
MVLVMPLLELPGRHHALHVLGLLQSGEKRFGEVVKATGHHDAEVARALEYLKRDHLVRARTVATQGKRILLAYGATAKGKAAWEAFEAYRAAIRSRASVLGQKEIDAVEAVLEA